VLEQACEETTESKIAAGDGIELKTQKEKL
jgi:hypothetical protein